MPSFMTDYALGFIGVATAFALLMLPVDLIRSWRVWTW